METLQNRQQVEQIYQGDYFSHQGAVAKAKGEYMLARSHYDLASYPRLIEYPRSKLLAYISTLSSAIIPAIKKGRLITAYNFLMALRTSVEVLRKDYKFKKLKPTELEVLLAVFTKGWIFPPKWVKRCVAELGDQILESGASYPTVALTNARLSGMKHLSEEMKGQYRDAAKEVVLRACESGLDHGLQWETVARIASMVNMPTHMFYAAYMDGRPDVVNKYGYSLFNVFVHKVHQLKQ